MLTKTEINDLLQAEQQERSSSFFERTMNELIVLTIQRLLGTVSITPIDHAAAARLTDRVHIIQQLRETIRQQNVPQKQTWPREFKLTDADIQQYFDQTVSRVAANGAPTSSERELMEMCVAWFENRDTRAKSFSEAMLKHANADDLSRKIAAHYLKGHRRQR